MYIFRLTVALLIAALCSCVAWPCALVGVVWGCAERGFCYGRRDLLNKVANLLEE